MKKNSRRKFVKVIIGTIFVSIIMHLGVGASITTVWAETLNIIGVTGKGYTFDEESYYEFAEAAEAVETSKMDTYGSFSIKGNVINETEKLGVPCFKVGEGTVSLFYNYGGDKLKAEKEEWHLVDDKEDKVDKISLVNDILKGAIIVQTSKDRKTWITVEERTNVFSDNPRNMEAIYETTDLQLINGCYYRVIVAYELRRLKEVDKVLFVEVDKYEYKKCAEVYEIYAFTDTGESDNYDPNQTHSLGTKVRVKEFDGYYGEKIIDDKDMHYGWNIGNFFVSGYTENTKDSNGNVVFLKNLGDKVTLWFKLEQDINAIKGNEKLSITADAEGFDQYFETPRMDFGRGTLIIRYTDHNNVSGDPVIYTNYLEANATAGADTKVQLFEEGDYEVALDYEVTNAKLIDKVGHYRIFFKFSVRNGNCMAYPFDVINGNELTNSSMTENGFRLDLAKSRYLKVNIRREVMKESADGLVEDTRFNGPAKDGAEYTDEGIYTITVRNEYTNQETEKKIYVGTNNVLKAHMASGKSIAEINELLANGATISDEGIITMALITPVTEFELKEDENISELDNKAEEVRVETESEKNDDIFLFVVIALALLGALVVAAIVMKRNGKKND